MTRPDVSVIMPAFNAANSVSGAIESVAAQTYENWELIVVDDGSNDGTSDIVQTIEHQDDRVRLTRSEARLGAARARNLAIERSQGRFIAFLDADDIWLPEKLSKQLTFMQTQTAVLSYTGFFRESGRQRRRVAVPPIVTYNELLRGNVIGCLTAIYDSALLGRKMLFPEIKRRHDYALWLTILKQIERAHGLNEPLAVHRRHGGNLSANPFVSAKATWDLYRRVEGLGIVESAKCLSAHYRNRYRALK